MNQQQEERGTVGKKRVADNKQETTSNGKFGKMFIFGLIVVLIVGVGVFYGVVRSAVRQGSDQSFIVAASSVFNIPVASINGENIPYSEYKEDMRSLRQFYTEQPANGTFTEEQISDQALSRLMVNELIEDIAEDLNVSVSQDQLLEERNALVSQFANVESANTEVQRLFGWSLDTYIERIVRPIILEQNVQEAFVSTNDPKYAAYETEEQEVRARHILFPVEDEAQDETVRAEAQQVLERAQQGEDFAALAAQYGSDGTSQVGGDLGWFTSDVMVPAFSEAAFAIEPGQVGDELVKTDFGYHIIKVEEKRNWRDFDAFMQDQLRNANIEIYSNIPNPFEGFLQNAPQQETEDSATQPDAQSDVAPTTTQE